MNNVSSIFNISCSKLRWMTTRSFGKVGMMLRVNMANSSTAEASLNTDLNSRKTRVKKSNVYRILTEVSFCMVGHDD